MKIKNVYLSQTRQNRLSELNQIQYYKASQHMVYATLKKKGQNVNKLNDKEKLFILFTDGKYSVV
jgi:hypothetical protein